ncbi:MAG: peptidylprolyl isomerase [Gammaproteobacteria bacterium]|nr:peptidylprolyl isomerase [Gammaproteobacteria bacterium]MDH5511865.1 peptidylprolyl isomerase [Gammaproteobacteria bacterium]
MNVLQVFSRFVVGFRSRSPGPACFQLATRIILAAGFLISGIAHATFLRVETNFGTIDFELYDSETPITVANFLRYAGRGNYTDNGFFHFSSPGFAIRAGGYSFIEFDGSPFFFRIPEDPPIPNEFSPLRPNDRGTIAMFNPPENPDGIASQWTINLGDNSSSINVVFGKIVSGMDVADAIGSLQNYNASQTHPAFNSIPLMNFDPAVEGMQPKHLVRVLNIPNVAAARVPSGEWAIFTADVDVVFDTLETVDPALTVSRIETFISPPDSFVHFNNDMITQTLSGAVGPATVINMYDGSDVRPTHYYAYGPTPDDLAPHWYDFAYDGETGAEIKNDRIILHFVDGKRGDEDLDPNNGRITHTGAQAVMTPITTSQSGGCTIARTPSGTSRGDEWALIVLFLLALTGGRKLSR